MVLYGIKKVEFVALFSALFGKFRRSMTVFEFESSEREWAFSAIELGV